MRYPFHSLLVTLWCIACCMTLSACARAPDVESLQEPLLKEFPRGTLSIERADGKILDFAVYIARTREQMMQGLMFVEELTPRTGMLFEYKKPRDASMWMKNTMLSLDIFFIDADGSIIDIYQNATPKSLKSMPSSQPVKGALELIAGSAKALSLKKGDRILHRHFGTEQ